MIDARSERPRLDARDLDTWWVGLIDLYREEARYADDPAVAARHLAEAARIQLEEAGDPGAAGALYAEAHALAPGDPLPARALAELAERVGDWADARRWFEAALEATPEGPGRVSLLARLAGILHDRLGERRIAAGHVREALRRAPDDRALLARLSLLVDDDDPESVLFLLERRLAVTEEPSGRAALLVEIGRIREAAHADDTSALDAFRSAFDADPDHGPALDGLTRVLLRAERYEDLVEVLGRAVSRISDEAVRGRLELLAAMVLGVRLDAPERARPHLGAAVASLGADPVAVGEIAGLYERLGLWTQANDVLRRRAGSDPDIWYRIGLNLEAGLGDLKAASVAHQNALAGDPESLLALAGLRRVAWRADDLRAWRRSIEGLLGVAVDPGARAAIGTHLADVMLMREADVESARHRYGEAVQAAWLAAGDTPVMVPAALEERMRLLTAQGNWQALDEELRRALDRPLHPVARGMIAGRLAELCEGPLGRPDDALELFGQVVAADPDDLYAHEARQRLLAARGDWPALLDALRAERARVDPRRRRIVLTRMADVQSEMGDPEGAEGTWREALELDPGWLPALRGLGRQLHQHGRWRDLAALHRHEITTLGPDDPRRAALLGKLAELFEFRLDQPDDALECYEALMAIRPGAPDAVAGLERLYRQGERWAALSRVLSSRANALADPAARAAVLVRLADVRLDRLDDPEGARAAYEEASRLRPALLPAGWALERLALETGDTNALGALYRRAVETAPTIGQKTIARYKLAAVVDPMEAGPALEAILDDVEAPEAGWALVRESAAYDDASMVAVRLARFAQLIEHRRDALALWREAAEQGEAAEMPTADLATLWSRVAQLDPDADRPPAALLRLHRAGHTPGAEAELLLARGERTEDDRERSLALWAAGLIEESRGMPSVGLDAFREALAATETDPTPAWLLLDRSDEGEAGQAVAHDVARLVDLARRQSDGSSAALRLYEAGLMQAESLGDEDGALALFLEAVRRDPGMVAAADRAEALLSSRGAWNELAILLQNRVDRLDAPAELLPLLRRLADVQLDHLGGRGEAAETLEQLVSLAPSDLDARVRLGDLRYSLDHFREAAAHYRTATMAAHDDRILGRLYTRLGRIRAHHLDDLTGAIEDLRRAVGLGTDEKALGELAQVYLMAGEADLALMAYQRLEKLADDPGALSAARAGQVHALLRRGRRAEAIERLTAFRAIDPIDPMLATLARDLELPDAPAETEDEPLLRPAPGRALAASPLATGTAIAALDLRRTPADSSADLSAEISAERSAGGSREGPPGILESGQHQLEEILDDQMVDIDIEVEDRSLDGPASPPALPDASPALPDASPASSPEPALSKVSAAIARTVDPVAAIPSPAADEDRAVSADIDAAFDALGEGLTPDVLRRSPPSPPVPVAPAPVPDRPVEAVVIPSPLDDSVDDALAALELDGPTSRRARDGIADTGSLQTLDPLDETGSLRLEALHRAADGRAGGSPAALLEALPSGSTERRLKPSVPSDVINLLQPDIDRQGSGSLPAVRSDSGGGDARATGEISLDMDASTAALAVQDITRAVNDHYASGQPTTPLSPQELATERVRVSPLDRDAWVSLASAVDAPIVPWVNDAVAWIDGEVRPARPAKTLSRVPTRMALGVAPDGTPDALIELLTALAPGLIAPVLAEGRRRTSSRGGRPIPADSPLTRMVEVTARRLGIEPLRLVDNADRPYSVALEEDDDGGLRLVLGTAILEGAYPVGKSFLIARSMIPVAYGTLAARQLRQRESRAFFGALLTSLGAQPPLRGRDRQRIEAFAESLAPTIDAYDDRARLESLAATVADHIRKAGIAGVRNGLDLFDNRLALCLADGFGGAVEMLRLLDFDDRPRDVLAPDELAQVIAESDLTRDLIGFAATPRCHAVRRWLHTDA